MFRGYKTFLVLLLAITINVDQIKCQSYTYGTSWIFRGAAQLNNTVLQFNMGDTLNLVCLGKTNTAYADFFMSITKGSSAPKNMTTESLGDLMYLKYDNGGTIVYDDLSGVASGFENVIVFAGDYDSSEYSGNYFRYMQIGLLHPNDAGTYHCNGIYYYEGEYFNTSGGLTIIVNTKPGQAHSPVSTANKFMTYSAIILGASKLWL